MRRLVLALDALPALREATAAQDDGVAAAALLAELAGADAVRLGLSDDLRPVCESDVQSLRRSARSLELRLTVSQTLLKVALETRPTRVVLAGEGRVGSAASRPLDLRGARDAGLGSMLRSLDEAGIDVSARIAPDLESVKAAHTLGLRGVELYTGDVVDLPASERRPELERLGDAARIAAKLRLTIAVGGGLGFETIEEILRAAHVAERVVAGRALVSRALLVGVDRAIRDFRALLA